MEESDFLARIEQHKGILHKVSRMYMDTAEDREDLVQEIILRLWKSQGSFAGNSAYTTWMYRVAVNTAITFLRKEKRSPAFTFPESLPEQRDEGPDSRKEEQLQAFYKAAQELTPIEKALIFYFMEGLSHREISQQLGITENNARVKLNRTKEKLQLILKKQGYEF